MSPKSTSAMSPSDASSEKPIPRAAAQSSIIVINEPDWLTKARSPSLHPGVRVAGVEAARGHHDAEARRSNDPQAVRLGRIQHLLPKSGAIGMSEAIEIGETTTAARVPRAPRSASQPGISGSGRGDHRQISG